MHISSRSAGSTHIYSRLDFDDDIRKLFAVVAFREVRTCSLNILVVLGDSSSRRGHVTTPSFHLFKLKNMTTDIRSSLEQLAKTL